MRWTADRSTSTQRPSPDPAHVSEVSSEPPGVNPWFSPTKKMLHLPRQLDSPFQVTTSISQVGLPPTALGSPTRFGRRETTAVCCSDMLCKVYTRVTLKMSEHLPSPQGKDFLSSSLPEVLNTYTGVISLGAEENLQGCPTSHGIEIGSIAQGSILELLEARPESMNKDLPEVYPCSHLQRRNVVSGKPRKHG